MIILGLILLVAGFLLKISILWTIGIIVLAIGVVLLIAGSTGHALAGRKHYFSTRPSRPQPDTLSLDTTGGFPTVIASRGTTDPVSTRHGRP